MCVVSVHCSPSTDFWAGLVELQSVVSVLLLYCRHIIIAGDFKFNVNLLTSTSISTGYTEFLTDYHLIQHISEPTRITSTSATLIDHILATPCTQYSMFTQYVNQSALVITWFSLLILIYLLIMPDLPLSLFVHFVNVIGPLLGSLWLNPIPW